MNREEVSIIVVDDVNTMRVQIKELLRSFGFRKVVLASNGEDVKKLLDTDRFHLILLDWHMEPTNGLELLKYIRSHPDYNGIAIIMVTAECTKPMVLEALQAGVDDYLLKPLTALQVQNKVYGTLLRKQVFK
jgi:two-component system, chemotaxis family, chemotaxis protein CheY